MNLTLNLLDMNRTFAIMAVSLLMAILFGLIATTANLVVIGIVVAIFIGIFLLGHPEWIIWIVLSVSLLILGVIPLFDTGADKTAGWAVSVLCFIMMPVALFKVVTTPEVRKNTPAYVWVLLVFFAYTELNSLFNWHSVEEFAGSFKRYFQMWGLIFALCWLNFDERHIRRWKMFFLFVALAQLPFAIYEYIVLVPLREVMLNFLPDMVPIDVVAGTFGATIYGGGQSGEMSTFLIIVLAFLLARKLQNTILISRLLLLIPWVLAPLFMGETKAMIIMLPVMFLVIYRRELLTRPHYAVLLLAVCTLLVVGMGYAYLNVMHMSLDKLFAQTLSYNLYEGGYGTNYLNRTTVLSFWAHQQGSHDPLSFVFGNGLGSSHQDTGGHIDIRYPHYGIGLTGASTLLWDTGVFGCVLLSLMFVLAWNTAGRLYKESSESIVKADSAAIQAALALFIFHLFYRLDLLETVSFQIVFAAVLGYLACLYRSHMGLMERAHL